MLAATDGHEILSSESMKGEAGWEAALNWPLPPHPDFYLLDEARRHIIAYLDWVTHDLARAARRRTSYGARSSAPRSVCSRSRWRCTIFSTTVVARCGGGAKNRDCREPLSCPLGVSSTDDLGQLLGGDTGRIARKMARSGRRGDRRLLPPVAVVAQYEGRRAITNERRACVTSIQQPSRRPSARVPHRNRWSRR